MWHSVEEEMRDKSATGISGLQDATGRIVSVVPNPEVKVYPLKDLGKKELSALAKQVGGDHYKTCGIQPVDYIEANKLGFLEGNVIKYVTRHAKKHGLNDLEKAKHYIELLIEMRYGDKKDE